VIAVGAVTGPPTYFVNPGDPTDEPLPEDIHPEQAREVVTFVPDQMLKGDARPAFLVVQDDLRLISVTDQRPVAPGDHVVIFLKFSPQDAPGAPADALNVMGVDQGVFDVTENGIAARAPELFVDGAVLPGTLDELEALVSPDGDEG
jgi:hypothetical protein